MTGSVDLVRKRLATLRPRSERPAQRTGYRPGQVLQIDWGEMPTRPRIAGRERRVYALVFSLPFSGAATAHFSFDMTIESFLEGHVRAFDWMGGVPRECVYDNLKSAVARRERVEGREVIHWNPRFSQLRGHYAFHAHAMHAGDAAREGLGRRRGPLRQDRVLARAALRRSGRARRALRRLARSDRAAPAPRDRPAHRRRAARARTRAAAAAAADRLRRGRAPILAGPSRRLSEVRPLLLPRARKRSSSSASSCAGTATGSGSTTTATPSRTIRAATSTGSGCRRRGCAPSRRRSRS